jgi:hypothetical protein
MAETVVKGEANGGVFEINRKTNGGEIFSVVLNLGTNRNLFKTNSRS